MISRAEFDRWEESCSEGLADGLDYWQDPGEIDLESLPSAPYMQSQQPTCQTVEEIQKDLAAVGAIEGACEGGRFNDPSYFEALDRLFGDAVHAEGVDVEKSEIIGAVVVHGCGFVPTLRATRKDGSSFITPATLPGGENVAVWTPKAFFAALGAIKTALLELEQFAAEDDLLSKNAYCH